MASQIFELIRLLAVGMKPQVSVILPYYEGSNWLMRSVASVRAQEGVFWELIVVDDGSKEPAGKILQAVSDPRVRLLTKTHGGKGKALNSGIIAAAAEIVCFIDQDDLMLPRRLRRQFDVFEKHPEIEVVYSDYERVFDDGRSIDRFISRQASNEECLHEMATGHGLVSMQTLMVRKHLVQSIGGFSEDIRLTGLDDAEFLSRLFASGAKMKYEPGVVQKWVQHENNYSRSWRFQEARLILLAHLDALSERHPMIRKEIPYFSNHNFCMRGLFFLENGAPTEALTEFQKMIRSHPVQWAGYHLWIKSFLRHLIG